MLTVKKVTKKYRFLHEVKHLYKTSFPNKERDPINELLDSYGNGHDIIAFEEEGFFIGFAYLMTYQNITHLLYFAIHPMFRKQGYGSKALSLLHELYKDNTIILDVESLDEKASNKDQRIKRINFYKKNGYVDTDISYEWDGISYNIMSLYKRISTYEFNSFWHRFESKDAMGKYLYQAFKPIQELPI